MYSRKGSPLRPFLSVETGKDITSGGDILAGTYHDIIRDSHPCAPVA
jgi:hypothetical protein